MWSTSKLDRVNQHGAPLCHAFGCRKHKRLRQAFRGWFCYQHFKELEAIRAKILQCKANRPDPQEVAWREEEVRLRKWLDGGHMEFLSELKVVP